MDIKDKIAIVTGGTGGIGMAVVYQLLKNKCKYVAILDVEVSKNRALSCLQQLELEFGKDKSGFYICDVTKKQQFADVYDSIVKLKGPVDIFVNNAGICKENDIDLMIDINVKGAINCAIIAIEKMGKHNGGKGGTIINTASLSVYAYVPALPVYVATKHAICGFTRNLKGHQEVTGVRVACICPGMTQSNMVNIDTKTERLPFMKDEVLNSFMEKTKDAQPPENVAIAVMKMLESAEPGSIWGSAKSKPPFVIPDTSLF